MSKYDDDDDDDRDRNRGRGRRRSRDEDDYEEDDRDERRSSSSKRRRSRDEEDEDEERDERGRPSRRRAREDYDDDDDDYEDERRPRPGVCPKCGSRRSSKVSFTWWGGLVGPAMFNLVQCSRCGQQYNSKKGTAVGAIHITLYSLVGIVIAVAVLILIGLMR